ncbi:MAG TPA: DUF3108 domain-containing protein [Bryobacteraceae bacterium]|nr:DUF3108 domain-containing protein [Bryobacteraceae bacterium]
MRDYAGALALFFSACWTLPAQTLTVPSTERLTYDIEWRLIHAGQAVVEAGKTNAHLRIESAGMVSTLFKVEDAYGVNYDEPFCATSSTLDAKEGKRHRETHVLYDRANNKASSVERDLLKNVVLHTYEVAIPNCVHDVLGALISVRQIPLSPGQTAQLPVSDGHRSASVRVEAQEREVLKTPTATYKTIRCETFLMNGVVYMRRGRVFVWMTDDEKRLPVQIQLRVNFPIGTVTLRLTKEEKL